MELRSNTTRNIVGIARDIQDECDLSDNEMLEACYDLGYKIGILSRYPSNTTRAICVFATASVLKKYGYKGTKSQVHTVAEKIYLKQ